MLADAKQKVWACYKFPHSVTPWTKIALPGQSVRERERVSEREREGEGEREGRERKREKGGERCRKWLFYFQQV